MNTPNQRFAATLLLLVMALIPSGAEADSKSVIAEMPLQIEAINAPFDMPQFTVPTFPHKTFSIVDFGAVEGGEVKNTKAIAKAIAAANKAGGGRVLIPAGKWLTGAIHLKSDVNLHFDKDALLLFSKDLKDFLPAVLSRHEGLDCYKPAALIYAINCSNIAITGKGTLHGQGKAWNLRGGRTGRWS